MFAQIARRSLLSTGRLRFVVSGLAIVVAATLAVHAHAQGFDRTLLGDFGGGFSTAHGINASGDIVGGAFTQDGNNNAFLYTGGSLINLGTLGGDNSQATDISDAGIIVGFSFVSDTAIEAFVYENNQMTSLGTLGGPSSFAFGINNNDQIVGAAENSNNTLRAVKWERDGNSWSITPLGQLGGQSGRAHAINDMGEVVGVAQDSNGNDRAFFWDEAGGMIDLGTLGGETAEATDINDAGVIVGISRNEEGIDSAFVLDNDEMTQLPTLGGVGATAIAINDSGIIAGIADSENGNAYAAAWDQAGVIRRVDSEFDAGSAASAINDFGLIAGTNSLNGAAFWTDTGTIYEAVDLGTLGGDTTLALAINANGQVVGTSGTGDQVHAFLWEDGSMTDLGTLGGPVSTANDVNTSEQVVGVSRTANGEDHAFLWQDGSMTDLGHLGGLQSEAHAINEAGQIVGSSLNASFQERAFISENGDMVDLGTVPAGLGGGANDINNNDQIAGFVVPSNGLPRAAIWNFINDEWEVTNLGTLGGLFSEAFAISEDGVVYGQSLTETNSLHAFRWDPDNGMVDLGVFAGPTSDLVASITGDAAVGRSSTISSEFHAMIFDAEEGAFLDLNDQLALSTPWELLSAVDINADGLIVGLGMLNGNTRGYIYREVETTQATITDFQVVFGTYIFGGIIDLLQSDDSYLRVRSRPGFIAQEPNLVRLRIGYDSGMQSATSATVTLEARLNDPFGTAKVFFRNWDTNQFEQVDEYSIGFNEETVTIPGVSADNFVRPTDGRVELELKYIVVATLQAQGFDSFLDVAGVAMQ